MIISDPKYAKVYYNRGIVKYNLKDKDGACSDWKKGFALGDTQGSDMAKEYCGDLNSIK